MKLRTALLAALVCLCQAAAVQATEPTGLASADMAAMPIAAPILDRLDAAWDAADGARFAAEFTDEADVINIFGEPYKGRADLARRMQFIFDELFKGSRHAGRELEMRATSLLTPSSSSRPPGSPSRRDRSARRRATARPSSSCAMARPGVSATGTTPQSRGPARRLRDTVLGRRCRRSARRR